MQEALSSQCKASALLVRSIPEIQVAVDQLKGQTDELWKEHIVVKLQVGNSLTPGLETTQKKVEENWTYLNTKQVFVKAEVDEMKRTLEANDTALKKTDSGLCADASPEAGGLGSACHGFSRQVEHDG